MSSTSLCGRALVMGRMAGSVFFGVGAGRCGTMGLANLLNSEPATVCLHEGKFRNGEEPGEPLLPFLTLQNGQAYARPETADALFDRFRGSIGAIAEGRSCRHFGDIAYNYAPFLGSISRALPEARIIALVRNGVDFVQSAAAIQGPDKTPVGWPPRDKPLTSVEQFIALGRWRPRPESPWANDWENWGHFERNAWLWAETNQVMLDAIEQIDPARVCLLRFEDFFGSLDSAYPVLRDFLGLSSPIGLETRRLMEGRPINHRKERALPPPAQWSDAMCERFEAIAGDVMRRLNYEL
jgi:hypothetical protein